VSESGREREREREREGERGRERERERESNEIMRTSIAESILPHPLLTLYWNFSAGGQQSSWVFIKSRKAPASSMLSRLCIVAEYAPIYL